MAFQDAIFYLQRIGVYDIILPFLLIFSILFSVLQKVTIFSGPERKRLNITVALAIALLSVIPHTLGNYPGGIDVVNVINNSLPQIALLIIAIIMVLLMMGVVRQEEGIPKKSSFLTIIGVLSVLFVIYIFLGSYYPFLGIGTFFSFLDDPGLQSLVVVLLIFGLGVYFVTADKQTIQTTPQTIQTTPGGNSSLQNKSKLKLLEDFFFGGSDS